MTTWLTVWRQAVLGPAWRRTQAIWVGAAILAAVVFGPTGMQPRDLTALALHAPPVGIVLALIWLAVFLPIAREIVRAEPARFLRSLPGPSPILLAAGALVAFQLPWLVLWLVGERALGLAIVAGWTLVIVAIAAWRPPIARPRAPARLALRGVHLRALRRRAGDALLRGAGLAVLAGAVGGLFIRNNQVEGVAAATLGACVIAIVLVPAQVGAMFVLVESHRQSAWLAASLGIARGARVTSLAAAIAIVHLAGTLLALVAAALVCTPDPTTFALLAVTCLAASLGTAFGETRAMLGAEHGETVAAQIVSGAIVAAAVVVLCLGTLGLSGIFAILASGALALATVPP